LSYRWVFDDCRKEEDLVLGGDVAFGVEEQFENEARMALRLAHFLSSFLQVCNLQTPRLCYQSFIFLCHILNVSLS
jgi:hypothetical protein